MTFKPLGMDQTLYDFLLPYRTAAPEPVAQRKTNPRPLRQDDTLRRLEWRCWLQWIKTVPIGPGTIFTAAEIDAYYRLTDEGARQMERFENG